MAISGSCPDIAIFLKKFFFKKKYFIFISNFYE